MALSYSDFSIAVATVAILQALDIYQVEYFQAGFLRISRLLLCWCIVFIPAVGLSHIARLDDASLRIWLAAFFCAGIVALIFERFAVRAVLRKWAKEGRLDRRTLIVGADENGERLIAALRAQEGSNLAILGVFDDRNVAALGERNAGNDTMRHAMPSEIVRELSHGAHKRSHRGELDLQGSNSLHSG